MPKETVTGATEGSDLLPAIFNHCRDVYELMRREGLPVEVEGVRVFVWEGFLTRLIRDQLKLSTPYFSAVKRELERMGCIKQLRRGGGTTPSQWEMITEPTEQLWREKVPPRTRGATEQAQLRTEMNDLRKRVDTLEEHIKVIVGHINTVTTVATKEEGQGDGNDDRGSVAVQQV